MLVLQHYSLFLAERHTQSTGDSKQEYEISKA